MMTSGWLQDDFRMTQRALSKQALGDQRILKEHSESTQRERDQSNFITPSDPKILRLVEFERERNRQMLLAFEFLSEPIMNCTSINRSSHRCFKYQEVGLEMLFRAGSWMRWLRPFRTALIILAKVFQSWQNLLLAHFWAPCVNRDCSNITCPWIRKISRLYFYFCNKQLSTRMIALMWRNLEAQFNNIQYFVDLSKQAGM